jgi:hypothetical protein
MRRLKEGNLRHSTWRPPQGAYKKALIYSSIKENSALSDFLYERKAIMVTPVHKAINKRTLNAPVENMNRRRTRRFDVAWPIILRGVDEDGQPFQEFSYLQNLCSGGAALESRSALYTGARVEMDVCCPLNQRQWLRYWGKVVSVESSVERQVIRVCFDSARPAFVPAAAVLRLQVGGFRGRRLHGIT